MRLGYDFLANDFRLRLNNSWTGESIALGAAVPGEDRSAPDVNFFQELTATVPDGVYTLEIGEDMRVKRDAMPLADGQCHRFSLFVGAQLAEQTMPRMQFVFPSRGENIDPFEPLTVSVLFSEPPTVPRTDASETLVAALNRLQFAYLENMASHAHIELADATIEGYSVSLTFAAAALDVAQTYKLELDPSVLQAGDGTPFAPSDQTAPYLYATDPCTCNDRGTCDNQRRPHSVRL